MGANIEILNETAAVIDETLVIQAQMANPIYQGPQGPAGNDGKTPVKGVDYFTSDDKQEIIDEVIENIGEVNVDLTDYYTKQETDAAIQAAKPDLTEYALKSDIPSLDGYATEEYVNEAIANIDIPEGGGGASAAVDVSFDDTTAGIGATNVQEALDYLADTAIDADAVQEQIEENLGFAADFTSLFSSNTMPFVYFETSDPTTILDYLKKYRIAKNNANLDRTLSYSNILSILPNEMGVYYRTELNSDGTVKTNRRQGGTITVASYGCILLQDMNHFITAPNPAAYNKYFSKIYYDNTNSKLTATTLPDAIDELADKINSLVDGNEVSY